MSELLNRSPEQSETKSIPDVPKSRELYTGDINAAVIDVQKMSGANISPEWWAHEVGDDGSSEEILKRFDKAYERMIWRNEQVPEEQIIALQSHEDDQSMPENYQAQINGINIPAEIAQDDEIDAKQWAIEEQKRREKYIFSEAEYYLNREFMIGDTPYFVDGIHYTGTNGDYTTLAIDIKNIETGAVTYNVELEKVKAMVKSEARDNSLTESEKAQTSETLEESAEESTEFQGRIEKELEAFDKNALFERAQFEAFLYEHPELVTDEPAANKDLEPSNPYSPIVQTTPTIDALEESTELNNEMIEQKRIDAVEEFDKFITYHPELEELRTEYMNDLDNYLEGIQA